MSSVFILEDSREYHVQLTSTPLTVSKFYISAEQVRLTTTTSTGNIQTEIMQEFASVMMEQRCNSRRGFEKCQDRQLRPFNQGPATNPDCTLSRLQFREKGCWRSLTPTQRAPPAPPDETPEEAPSNQPALPHIVTLSAGRTRPSWPEG